MAARPPFRPIDFPEPEIEIEHAADGSVLFSVLNACDPLAPNLFAILENHAEETPDVTFVAERARRTDGSPGDWNRLTYGQMHDGAVRLAQGLLDRGWGAGDVILILSENSLDHALLMFGAYAAQIAVAPVSPGFSLQSKTHEKLKHVFALTRPKAVFVQDGAKYADALRALDLSDTTVIAVTPTPDDIASVAFDDLFAPEATSMVTRSIFEISPSTVGKVLFTSGSTGMPKGVIQSQGMMVAAITMAASVRRFKADGAAYKFLDWLPWSHAFGGNSNLNGTLLKGGSFYIDAGRPLPGQFGETLHNLKEIAPTLYSSTPSAFGMLVSALEEDTELRTNFFSALEGLSYGGAALPTDLADRMQQIAIAETGNRILFMTGYGATETGPAITSTWFETDRVGLVGLPFPGAEVKMVPHGDVYELRFRGPCVTPGYFGRPDLTKEAFDEQGFYRIGDAGSFVDPDKPELGLKFEGRVAEEFKLLTGTWVQVGRLRVALLAACSPYLRDAVITGHDRDFVGALVWLNDDKVQGLGEADLCAALKDQIAAYNAQNPGSSNQVKRLLVLDTPPSVDGHELTDKGYINQRAALQNRADWVERLYADAPDSQVLVID